MTAVIAYVKNKKVYMISDSCGSTEWKKNTYTQDKCFEVGELKIGFCGNFASGQKLFYSNDLKKLKKPKNMRVDRFMFEKVLPIIKHLTKDDDTEDSDFIVSHSGRIFVISGIDFYLLEPDHNYVCIGSGEDILYGAVEVHGKELFEKNLTDNLIKVMVIIEKYHKSVQRPFKILT